MSPILGIYASSHYSFPVVTGGNLVSDATYYYRFFTNTNYLTISNIPLTADILVFAGGGSGNNGTLGATYGAGGGAGGFTLFSSQSLSLGSYTCTVGGGGSYPGSSSTGVNGGRGTDSKFGSLTTVPGGYGGGDPTPGPYYSNGGNSGNGFSGGAWGGGGGYVAGGGAGNAGNGLTGVGGVGGVGGPGTNTYSSWLSAISTAMNTIVSGWSTATNGYIGGGGAGGPATTTGGVGGGGGTSTATVNTGSGGAGPNNAGVGNGGSGLIIVRYTRSQVGG